MCHFRSIAQRQKKTDTTSDLWLFQFHSSFVTARKRSLGQGNIFSSVCQEFCLSTCWDTPWSRHPPPRGTRHPPRDQAPPCTVHAGRFGQQAGGMHPTGMQSCFHMILVIWTEHHLIILSMPPSPIPTQIWDHHCTINSADPSKPDGTMT